MKYNHIVFSELFYLAAFPFVVKFIQFGNLVESLTFQKHADKNCIENRVGNILLELRFHTNSSELVSMLSIFFSTDNTTTISYSKKFIPLSIADFHTSVLSYQKNADIGSFLQRHVWIVYSFLTVKRALFFQVLVHLLIYNIMYVERKMIFIVPVVCFYGQSCPES